MSTRGDQAVSVGTITWAAERVLDMHVEQVDADRTTGLCGHCQPDGQCRMLQWPRVVLAVGPQFRHPGDQHVYRRPLPVRQAC
jgi:hypothetical protein